MNILVSNDDGIHAKGIEVLVKKLRKAGHTTCVAAPLRESSGTGHGVTLHRPLRVIDYYKNNEHFGYAIDGKPSDCVKLGYWGLFEGIKFDFIISGINKGENLGSDVLYSGTVSAASEGALIGIRAIAVSAITRGQAPDYDTAADFLVKYLEDINDVEFPRDSFLNINVPNIGKENIKGYKYTKQGDRKYEDNFIERIDPQGNKYYWLGGEAVEYENDPKVDFNIVKSGYISITPINLNLTDENFMDTLKKRGK